MIDYAKPAMNAEHAMKELHWAAIEGDLDEAIAHGTQAIAEVRLTVNALRHMKEQRDALRKQTETV